jgi:hypothetical protein
MHIYRVSFTTLCDAPGVQTTVACGSPIIDQVGVNVETWAVQADANVTSQPELIFPETTCRSLTLNFGFNAKLDYGSENNQPEPGLAITVRVAQSDAPPRSTTVTNDQIGTLTLKLNGNPWIVSTMANQSNSGSWNIYINGYASCTSSNGE